MLPEPGKREKNRIERRKALLDAGLRLFVERGVEVVSIDEITRSAQTAKGNFYRYFDDKASLVGALLSVPAHQTRHAMRRCAIALSRAKTPMELGQTYGILVQSLTQTAIAHPLEVRLFLQEKRLPPTPATQCVGKLSLELERGAILLSQQAIDRGLLATEDPRVSALAVIGAVEQLAIAFLAGRLDVAPLEIGAMLVRLVLDGIRK